MNFASLARIAALTGVVAVVAAGPAGAEFQFGAYGGWNGSADSDVTYTNSSVGPDAFTMHGVPWDGLSFVGDGGAPYYGLRTTYWFDNHPGWGVMVDFTHAKVRAGADATVPVTGTVLGAAAPATSLVSALFDRLEFTDGLNLLTLNGVYRAEPIGRFRPYIGAGAGIAFPNVEVTRFGSPTPTFEYQLSGWTAQLLAGVNVPVWRHVSLFGEYKLSYTDIDADLADGGSLATSILTHHALVGVALSWGGQR